jgi:hypothetical protein
LNGLMIASIFFIGSRPFQRISRLEGPTGAAFGLAVARPERSTEKT